MPEAEPVHQLSADDRIELLTLDQAAFGFDDRDLDPVAATAWLEWDRTYGVRRDDELAGIYVVYTLGLGVPAAPPALAQVTPMAGLSWVAVHPDHRRRGLLRTMIGHHFRTLHESGSGEAVSGLFASEPGIYGRFGYGQATRSKRFVLGARQRLRPAPFGGGEVTTRLQSVDPEHHRLIARQICEAEALLRPGLTLRPDAHWTRHLADDPARRPAGVETLKIVLAHRDGAPTGYATLRRSQAWNDSGPTGTATVTDMHAVDPASAHAVWQRALDLDLMSTVKTPWLPQDHPLLTWAAEGSLSGTPGPSLWIRLVDLAEALSARGYGAPIDVVLEVTDDGCPWNAGRWRLAADADGARCDRTTDAADLSLDVRELGSAYLGGVSFAELAAAGLLSEQTKGAVDACTRAWVSPLAPATPYMF